MHAGGFQALAAAVTAGTMALSACATVGARNPGSVAVQPPPTGVAAPAPSAAAPTGAPHITATHPAVLRPLTGTPPAAFTAIDFLNAQDGWVSGDGTVGLTVDGGATWSWHALPSLTPESLSFVDARQGYIAAATDACFQGSKQAQQCATVLLHTADGGATWIRPEAAACGDLCGAGRVEAMDPAHAWALVGCRQGGVVGQPCKALLVTSDGGTHWAPVTLPGGVTSTDFDFVTATRGWVVGVRCPVGASAPAVCPTAIEHTSDGGRTWQADAPPDALAGGGNLSFADAENGWLVPAPRDYCTMGGCWVAPYATTDGGRTWTKLQSTYGRIGFQRHPVLVSPTVGFIPIAAGAGIGIGGVVRTVDGGRTWASAGDAQDWSVQAVSAVGPEDLWAIGAQKIPPVGSAPGFLVHSTDGGRTWTQQLPALRPSTAVDFLDANDGCGIGTASDPGAVLATTDGGAHWTVTASQSATGARLRYVSFADPEDGWAAGVTAATGPGQGGQPLVLATRDGGRTWTAVAHPTGTVMGLSRFDPTHGALVTSTGQGGPTPAQWARTADGGASWQATATVPPGGQLTDVGTADPSHGWAIDFSSGPSLGFMLITTADGGRSWTPVTQFPFGQGQIALHPTGPRSTWIVQPGEGKTDLLWTTDGGRTWTRESAAPVGITDIDFLGTDRGWLLTPAAVWRTQDGGRTWAQVA